LGGAAADGAPATNVHFERLGGIAADVGGSFFIAETTANRARKMTPAGIISTLAGNAS